MSKYDKVRRTDKQITDPSVLEEILNTGQICHIAFASQDEPYLVTMNYGYHENCLYFHAAPEGKKMYFIRKNPEVCFQVITGTKLSAGENPCKDWSMKYKSVFGYGKAIILTDKNEKISGLNILMNHYTSKGPFTFSDENIKETTIIKIEIESLTGKISG